MNVLCVDVGGSHVKVLRSGLPAGEERRVASGPDMTPSLMIGAVQEMTSDWARDVISIGIPSVVRRGRIAAAPLHLGEGWVDFDFGQAFDCPVRVINDAAMQAIGSWRGGRMLFLGLGTGLGSAMILDGMVQAMELSHLPYRHGRSYEDYLGEQGREKLGNRKWRKHVWRVVNLFRAALQPDEVVIGGGNVAHLDDPPDGVRLGDNYFAFIGGFRLWQDPTFGSVT
ncbi:MAG TPA: ROK family protein [Gemmatimonadales bacterium]|nr:ROK family protein [Gemmatimonadales bacterium]